MQTVLRWHTHEPTRAATAWKDIFSEGHPEAPWAHLVVAQSNSALSMIARTPEAGSWLRDNIGNLSRAVMTSLGRVVTMEHIDRQANLRDGDGFLWAYDVPKVIVAKSGDRWDDFNQASLSAQSRQRLEQSFSMSLQSQFALLGISEPKNPVQITICDDGQPMPISLDLPSSNAHSSPRRPSMVLARKSMKLTSKSRFEGDFSVGKLASLGFGRVFRDGYAELGAQILSSTTDQLEESST